MTGFPLPFECSHEHYQAGAQDDHGNTVPTWATPAVRECFWWSGESTEASAVPSGSDQARVDCTVVLDVSVPVDHRDRFTVDDRKFEVVGLPKEWDHGPFGFAPNRQVVELRFVG